MNNKNEKELYRKFMVSIFEGDYKAVEKFLMDGIDPDDGGSNKKFPLVQASESNSFRIVKLLLKYGADVNKQDRWGNNALAWALSNDDMEIMDLLLKNGANPNIKISRGLTALNSCAITGNVEHAKILLRYGADPSIKANSDYDAFENAFNFDNFEVLDLLTKYERKKKRAIDIKRESKRISSMQVKIKNAMKSRSKIKPRK